MNRIKLLPPNGRNRVYFEPYRYILPAIIVILLINFYPLVRAVVLSLQQYNLLRPDRISFIGPNNYRYVLSDPLFWGALKRTAIFTLGGVSVELCLGFALALLFNREFWGKSVMRALMLLPMILSPVAVGLVWRIFYDADAGMVNYFFSLVGLPTRAWLGHTNTALYALIATDVWQWTSFCFLVCLAGLEGLPTEPYESAKIDGANVFESLTYITLPLMKPILGIAFILRSIDSVKMFDLAFIMTSGGPSRATETVNFFVYQTGFKFFHIGRASAQAIILTFIVSMTCMFFLRYLLQRGELYET